jgi:hypothetical protein
MWRPSSDADDVNISRYRVPKTRAYSACVMRETPVQCKLQSQADNACHNLPSALLLE